MSLEYGRPTEVSSHAGSGDRLLPWSEVEKRVPYSRQHVGRLEAAGKFPRRVQVGPGRVAWVESEICRWQESRPRGPLPMQRNSPKSTDPARAMCSATRHPIDEKSDA